MSAQAISPNSETCTLGLPLSLWQLRIRWPRRPSTITRSPMVRTSMGRLGLVVSISTLMSERSSGITVTRATASLTSTEAALAALAKARVEMASPEIAAAADRRICLFL